MPLPVPEQAPDQKPHARDDEKTGIIVSNSICLAIGLVAILLRLFSRRLARSKIGLDDWSAVLALVRCQKPYSLHSKNWVFTLRL